MGSRDAVRRKRGKTDARGKAEELHEQGMPFQMAMAVAHGKLSLNDALERMARQEKVNKVMREHDLSRALATQVVLGHVPLSKVLRSRALDAHREANRLRTCLEVGRELVVHVHGGGKVTGTVKEVQPYSVTLTTSDGEQEIHKLQLKFAYDPADWKRARKVLKSDKALSKAPQEPVVRPQDRYSCSDKRLFRYVDNQTPVMVTSLEGDVLRGQISWFGRYEFGLAIKGEAEVVFFRHALADLREA